MKNKILIPVIILIVLIAGIIIFNFSFENKIIPNNSNTNGENSESIISDNLNALSGDPSILYCSTLGYDGKVIKDENGEYAVCVFPDETECDTWEFFRGKCGEDWSYCELEGYEIKNLSQYEGWNRGAICLDKVSGEELGNVYDLMNINSEERNDTYTGGGISTGVADPSVIYCTELGYKGRLIVDKDGGEHMMCMFPDETECDTWEFFRGKCGTNWTYCALEGYDVKDLTQYEGWVKGGICINKNTKEEVGEPYEMMHIKGKSSCNKMT